MKSYQTEFYQSVTKEPSHLAQTTSSEKLLNFTKLCKFTHKIYYILADALK